LKKLINQIFIIPLMFLIFGIVLFGIFYGFFINDIMKNEFYKAKKAVIEAEKKILKTQLDSIVVGVDSIRAIGFDIAESILKSMIEMFYKNYAHYDMGVIKFFKNHYDDSMFFYIISHKVVYPKIAQTYIEVGGHKRLIVMYDNKKFLAVEKKEGDKILGIAFNLDLLESIIQTEIKEYVDRLNKFDKDSYVAIGKVTDWFAKSGSFGYIFYHPFEKYIGKPLDMDKPDARGFLYRKAYFECLKKKKSCFLKYYYKNPSTKKEEEKISYFSLYKPYNLIFVKGFYISKIAKDINAIKNEIIKDTKELLISTLLLLIIFSSMSFGVAAFIAKKIMQKILQEYERIKKSYIESQKQLQERIYYDRVTNLPNQVKLREEIDKYKSLIILDIDNFASINNLYGFEFGDEILKCFANYLKSRFKNVYKVGSDEFAIPMRVDVKEKSLEKISKWDIKCNNMILTFKIGGSNVKDLFVTAEDALKLAQKRNLKYLIYTEKLKQEQQNRFEMLNKIKKILQEDGIIPYYQCIVDKEENIVKYEALMRLKYKDEILSPFVFMDILKETKLYHEFSRAMIKKVFKEVILYNLEEVSINISYIDISEPKTRKLIIELLKAFMIGDRITFEILESESVENFEEVRKFIDEVKEYGSKIAVDDFGSGYSNLINILSLEPEFIKIDGSLIKNLDNEEYYEIVKFVNDFGKKFNIKTVAEFVENEKIVKILKEIGVDYYQGYYYCKPKPISEIKNEN